MSDDRSVWSSTVLAPGAELIIGWRPRRSRLDAAAVELSAGVAAELHALCVATIDQLAGLTRREYGGSPYIEPDEEYLAVPATQLHQPAGQADQGRTPAGPAGDEDATGLSDLERLIATPGLPAVSAQELREGRYLCYAVVCTDRPGRRIGFVRQSDPHRVAKAGGLMTLLGGEGLRELTDPVFIFEASFDLVVSPGEIAVLRLEAFNRMFADLHTLAAAAPVNAKAVSASVDRMTGAAVDALARAAAARPALARQLQRLTRPGATPQVTPGDLVTAMAKHSLDPAGIVQGGEVVFGEDSAGQFLDLLEQLYYETDFTGEHRRSDRYSPLRPPAGGAGP
ncbi:MAG TPA: hypothetical protein VGM53_33660 [Streptosporangiaceae bacterium]|jgi:hypothetical protein